MTRSEAGGRSLRDVLRAPMKRRATLWLLAVLGLALFAALVSRVRWVDFLGILEGVDLRWATGAWLAGLLATGFRVVRFGMVFPPRGRWLELYGGFGLMRALGTILPFRSGDLVFLEMLKRRQLAPSVAETLPAWLVFRSSDVLALGVWLVLGLVTMTERAHPIVNGPVAVGVLLGVGSMLLVLILLLARYPKTGPQWSGSSWLSGRLKVMRAGLRHTARPGMVIGSFLFALAVWGSMLACVTLFQLALGSPLSVDGCFRAAVAISVLSLLPIHAPMTIGTGEAVWTGIMVASGMAMEPAILMALGIRVLSLVLLSVDSGMGALLFGLRGGSGVSPAGGGGAADARP